MQYKMSTGKIITIEDKYFAKGGEAKIYKIVSPSNYNGLVVKIYDKTISEKKLKKIQYLMNNFSFSESTHKQIINSIILPKHLVYDNQSNVVGFTMDMVENKITLREVLLNELDDNYKKLKLSKENSNAFSNRLIILYNLIQALKELHHNNIILVDMKPENILINKDGEISFIDLDSVQIFCKESKTFYPAGVHTDEYAPIENINYKKIPLEASWDLFILGVIAYQLFFRVHPYMVTNNDQLTQEEYKQKGMFAHGRFKEQLHLLPPHKDFNNIDVEIQKLFIKCLDIGCVNPLERPSLKEWEQAIKKLIVKKPMNIHSWNYGVAIKVPHLHNPQINTSFKKPNMTHKITKNSLDATISWDIQNAKEVYLGYSLLSYKGSYLPIENRVKVSFKDSLDVPLLNTLFQFVIIDYNNNQKFFDIELDLDTV